MNMRIFRTSPVDQRQNFLGHGTSLQEGISLRKERRRLAGGSFSGLKGVVLAISLGSHVLSCQLDVPSTANCCGLKQNLGGLGHTFVGPSLLGKDCIRLCIIERLFGE